MEGLRKAARESLQQQPDSRDLPAITLPDNITLPDSLDSLWQDLSSRRPKGDAETSEDLLVAQGFLDQWGSTSLSDRDEVVLNYLYVWSSRAALPGPAFGDISDPEGISEEKKRIIKASRVKSTIAISVISSLATLLPIEKAADKPDIVIALASFTSDNDPWTTNTGFTKAREALQSFTAISRAEGGLSVWSIVEQILKERIKPLFAKMRNPAITDAGRKNFHPVPLTRFDTSILDPESKPWKVHDPYATTVFEWVIAQYHSSDKEYLERHFPLLIPPTLSLIDDENLAYKSRGCNILLQLLKPIKESESDILRRTNLSSVFEDAIKQCFFSLPTITPENDSIRLLEVAYPALLSVLKTAYQLPTVPMDRKADDRNTYITGVIRILRDHIIPSFHHISSTNTISAASASFPYPRLSTLLVNQLRNVLPELGIHTTKYLQEIIPVLYSTLSNPFGPAHVPLLLASVAAMRAVISNAHPRLWRWRGEILAGVCACWVYALEEEGEIAERAEKRRGLESDKSAGEALGMLKKELKGVVYLLKLVLENPVDAGGDEGQLDAKQRTGNEVKELVDADDVLMELLLGDIDPEDGSFFGC